MELHKDIKIDDSMKLSLADSYKDYFSKALDFVNQFYKEDLDRILSTDFNQLTSEAFFREFIWCVYTSGFNAKIVSKFFPRLQEVYAPIYLTFAENKTNINSLDIATNALNICNNKRKVKAVIDMAFIGGAEIHKLTWDVYKNTKLNTPEKLQELPFIGPITCFHLGRNMGLLDCVKPDLHLTRAAKIWKFNNPLDMCKQIKKDFDLPLGIIDLVLFYALSTFGSKL